MGIIITPELVSRIEETLLSDAAITQAKVIDLAAADAPEQDLVIAIALHPDVQQSDESALRTARRALVKKLRDVGGKAVVPRKWARPAALPLTPTGEVDDIALRQNLLMEAAATTPDEGSKAPVESLDDKIMRIVAQAVQIPQDQLVQTRSFQQNGGDSFTAIQVFQCLMRENVSLRVPDIMRSETLAELPALVISRSNPAGPAVAPNVAPQPSTEVHEIRLPDVDNAATVSVAAV